MRFLWSFFVTLVMLGAITGCGGESVETPENPTPPPQGDPDSDSATLPAPD